MQKRERRFRRSISSQDLQSGRTEYIAMCPAMRGNRHDWGAANAVEELQDDEGRGGHVSILECRYCHKVIYFALTV